MAKFDVLLPVKNGELYLSDSIESIRQQTASDWRLLILDHGSTDDSIAIAHRHAEKDPRVEVHPVSGAKSFSELLNCGLAKCEGRFIVRHDGDDLAAPNRVQCIDEAFEANPQMVAIGSEAISIDQFGHAQGYMSRPTTSAALQAASLFYMPMIYPSIAIDRRQFEQLGGGYGKDILRWDRSGTSMTVASLAEDYFLFGQLALMGRCMNIPLPLLQYRVHGNSVSVSKIGAQLSLSLDVSRFLASSLSTAYGSEKFDPVPFCNHADYVFDLGSHDYEAEFRRMANSMRASCPQTPELERELAFRRVLAVRAIPKMLTRYFSFARDNGFKATERRTVRNWVLRGVRRGKYVYKAH